MITQQCTTLLPLPNHKWESGCCPRQATPVWPLPGYTEPQPDHYLRYTEPQPDHYPRHTEPQPDHYRRYTVPQSDHCPRYLIYNTTQPGHYIRNYTEPQSDHYSRCLVYIIYPVLSDQQIGSLLYENLNSIHQ